MVDAPRALYTVKQIRDIEQAAKASGFALHTLMLRAGTSAFQTLCREFPHVRVIAVYCGGGNNGGDGYVLARLAHEYGLTVTVYQAKASDKLPEPAQSAAEEALDAGVACQWMDDPLEPETELIVDALFGIGLNSDVKAPLDAVITQINESGLPVLSLDIPSGLHADTGCTLGVCVQATHTVTFIGLKIGMMMCDGPDCCKGITVADLQLGDLPIPRAPVAMTLDGLSRAIFLSPRRKNSHKGQFGHVLIVGGGTGMPGAAFLAAKAALRTGAGLVTVATKPEHEGIMVSGLPEAIVYGLDDVHMLQGLLEKATVCVVGPGLGEDEWAFNAFKQVLASHLPMIVDASALNLLAKTPQQDDHWILTPHPKEAARLLNRSAHDVQHDRLQAVHEIQQQYGGTVVLKGVGSLVCTEQGEVFLCARGNPGMSTAGMGDVLSGILGGLVAQGLSLSEAAKWGVQVHAEAGDAVAKQYGERGMMASDLLSAIQRQMNV